MLTWLSIVIALGLASRSGAAWIPPFLALHSGDALWTVAVFCSLAFLRPGAPPEKLAMAALAISFAVEASQLWHPAWLEQLRRTLPGRLLLGQGWQAADLLRYAAGAAIAIFLDRATMWRRRIAA